MNRTIIDYDDTGQRRWPLNQEGRMLLNELLLNGWTYKVSRRGEHWLWHDETGTIRFQWMKWSASIAKAHRYMAGTL